jgi:pimeloyl-ACP methyl ester carboxylesterase
MARGIANGSHLLRIRAASAIAVVGLIAVSLSTPSAAATTARPGRPKPGIAWTRCTEPPAARSNQFQCAKVPVPLDWAKPNGTKIELAVIRRLASRPRQRIGSMFVNPGGPGQSGYELVANSGQDFDEWGGGRFDVVGWDPRGTNRSSPVECFTSQAAEDRFWAGVFVPITPAESASYQRKTVELARRCGEVSGALLSHITTTDTARDLDALRALVGDRKITYVGLSYGSMIGQIYANLFPGRVRAMMLDGIVDAVDYTTSAEANLGNSVSSADEVFAQFLALGQSAGPGRCALAGHGQTVAQRVAGLFARARRAPIPAPHANPPGTLSYGDLLQSTFTPLRLPLTWPEFAANLNAAANGDGSALKTEARLSLSPQGMSASTTSAAISCGDAPARLPSSAWPLAIRRFTNVGKLWGPVLGWSLWAPCASNWPAHATDRYTGPWNAKTKTPILLVGARYDPGTPYRNAQVAERRLGNAVLLTLDGWGHPSYQVPSTCIDRARVRYLVKLIPPRPGTHCQPDEVPFH